MANFLAQLLDRTAEFSKYFSKTTDNIKKQSMKCFLQSKCTFKNVIVFTVVFQECLKILRKVCCFEYEHVLEKDMSSLCDKWMLILKGRFHHFQLSNRSSKAYKSS